MRLEAIERAIRWAGAAGALASVAASSFGTARGAATARAEEAEDAPEIARPFPRGSARNFGPSSVLGIGLLYLLWRPIYRRIPTPVRAFLLVAGSLLYFPGLALVLWGRVTLRDARDVSNGSGAELRAGHPLVTGGPFALMRHPMYVGGTMAEIGALLLYRTWTTLLITINIPLLPISARREEQTLASLFGDEWTAYARRVPMWLPSFPPSLAIGRARIPRSPRGEEGPQPR